MYGIRVCVSQACMATIYTYALVRVCVCMIIIQLEEFGPPVLL